jgi:hypothetical protein
MQKDLKTMFEKSSFSISVDSYFYCQIEEYPINTEDHFMISNDGEEITAVTKSLEGLSILEKNNENWLLVSLNLDTPFMKGTLFNVSKVIYESDSNILIISTFSKDLLFIKQQDKEKVKEALSSLGFKYKE